MSSNRTGHGLDREVFWESFRRDREKLVHELNVFGTRIRSEIREATMLSRSDPKGDWWKALIDGAQPTPAASVGRQFRTVDLFCGSGGFACGLRQFCGDLGIRTVAELIVDEDEDAMMVYASNNETRDRRAESVSSLVDYRLRDQAEETRFVYAPEIVDQRLASIVAGVDLVMAGPPCQGHSNLNNQTRRDDVRNALYLTVPAVAVAAGARMAIVENVPEVTSDRSGVVQRARRLFESAGYSVTEGVLSADALGWPQRRRRHFLIARVDAKPIALDDVEVVLGDTAPRSLWWAIGDIESGSGDEVMDGSADLSEDNQRRVDWLFDHNQYELPLPLRPKSHHGTTSYKSVYCRLRPSEPSQTITTGFMTPGRGRYIHPTRRRTLTPREAARLQGFPDTYRFVTDPEGVPSRSKLAKWIGDAVPTPLGYAAALAAMGRDLRPFLD